MLSNIYHCDHSDWQMTLFGCSCLTSKVACFLRSILLFLLHCSNLGDQLHQQQFQTHFYDLKLDIYSCSMHHSMGLLLWVYLSSFQILLVESSSDRYQQEGHRHTSNFQKTFLSMHAGDSLLIMKVVSNPSTCIVCISFSIENVCLCRISITTCPP